MAKIKVKKSAIISGVVFFAFGAFLVFSVLKQSASENPAASVEEGSAVLFITPEEGTFIIDEDFQVSVNVDTGTEINAAKGKIHFPVDKLEVVRLSKEESIFELWVQEPSLSNTNGTIEFDGGLPTPGFKGKEGKILTITFKPKEEGEAEIKFEQGMVLANDGKRTDILRERKGSFFTLISPAPSDLNNDGSVDLYDLSILLSNWGVPKNPKADINKDGKVDITDSSILIFDLGKP